MGTPETNQAATATVRVPFVDLDAAHDELRPGLLARIEAVVESGSFVNGPEVAEFEAAFAEYCSAAHCVGVASGLDALRLALIALGIGPGDEVVLPANTFVATAEAVTQAGATPVLVDASPSDYNIDPEAAEAAVTSRTRALLPVHLYGQLADVRTLQTIAARHGIAIVEDACQAHGASRDGVRAGAAGAAAAFSFYPAKNLGAFGDAGALTTNDEAVADSARALREHGQRAKYEHDAIGYTARLDTIQAAVLTTKLAALDRWNEQRRTAAVTYRELLDEVGDLVLPREPPDSNHVYHLFVVQTEDPEALAAFLGERGIASGRHYPQPVHLTRAYAHLGYGPGAFPVAELLASRVLSLPMYPGISEAQVHAVARAVRDYFAGA